MQLRAPEVCVQVRDACDTAFRRAGGAQVARRAERDPDLRRSVVRELVDSLGVAEVDARAGIEEAMTAAEICRAAGRYAIPYPLVAWLAAPPGYSGIAVACGGRASVDHADILAPMAVVDLAGTLRRVVRASTPIRQPLAPFVSEVVVSDPVGHGHQWDAALWMTLSAWWVLGACESAADLTATHVSSRSQFGGPLAKLQSVRFRVADMAVATGGLHEMLKYTAWRLVNVPEDALVDALAARVLSQETWDEVFGSAHQLHGALGFCDDHDLSVLSRHLQPFIRLPLDQEASLSALLETVDQQGLEGLYGRFR